ncbi:UNVERIFIED_CONTAM: hypothetical protein RMT77_013935 [Armadillidium vulgare]
MTDEPFTKRMRKESHQIHNISDALINAKLGIAMSDDKVWAEGLLLFYEIFKHLESALDRLKDTTVAELDIPGMRRTTAFEKDLTFYLGNDWRENYTTRDSVLKYISHLTEIEENKPILLVAYIYHLYMGLFAGGQILKKKRALVMKLKFSSTSDPNEGLAVVSVGPDIYKIKKKMTDAMNAIAETLDENTKDLLIKESQNVFKFNNEMVRTIKGADSVFIRKMLKTVVAVVILASLVYYFKRSQS